MSVEIKIIIPSHLRADRVLTTCAISNAAICVPESQADEYRRHNPENEIIIHPDSIKGLNPKRQWIIENFPNSFQLDDDITHLSRLYTEQGEEYKLTPDEAYSVVQMVGNCAKLAGCYLFGINKEMNPLAYIDHKPIKLTGYAGAMIGVLEGSKLFFDPQAVLSEDYYISAINAYYHRYCWIDTRFAIATKSTFANVGGCASYRTTEQETKDTLFLRQQFGEAIRLKKDTGMGKRKFEAQRTLVIPF